jgi:hypothetical protein
MAKQTTEIINETSGNLLEIERQLESARETRNELNRQLRNGRRRYESKIHGTGYPDRLFGHIIKVLQQGNELTSVLIRHIDNAIEQNIEFDLEPYKAALYSVAQDKEIYKFFRTGAGWDTRLIVQVVFEESAGGLVDWARGITAYRQILKTKVGDTGGNRGAKATQFWATRVFRHSLEIKTVNGRLSASGRKAPFWQILNNGSSPLSSDRPDGSYNPVPSSPTDFVGRAERSIESLFLSYFLPEQERWFAEARELSDELDRVQEMRDSYTREIHDLSLRAAQNRRIYESFGVKKQYVDEHKLADAIKKARAGEEFNTATIELTKRGSPSRVRLSVKKLLGEIDY